MFMHVSLMDMKKRPNILPDSGLGKWLTVLNLAIYRKCTREERK